MAEPWTTSRLVEVQKSHGLVAKEVVDDMQELLDGQLQDEPLTQAELSRIARRLISKMASPPEGPRA